MQKGYCSYMLCAFQMQKGLENNNFRCKNPKNILYILSLIAKMKKPSFGTHNQKIG
jgi:hypothetical protein